MATDLTDDQMAAPDPATSRRLFQFGAGGLAAAAVGLVYKSQVQDALLLSLGVAVMVIGAMPALNWARKGSVHFPVFEMFMLTSIPFYAVPLISGHRDVLQFTDAATLDAAIAMLLFQLSAVGTFFATQGKPIRAPAFNISLLPDGALRYAQAGIWLNTAYLYAGSFTEILPIEFKPILRAMFFGIGTVSLFIMTRRWGAGQLAATEKFAVSLNVFAQLFLLFRELYLIVGISLLLLSLIGYISTSRRIPVLLLAIALPVIAVLHNGKATMRLQYWENHRPLPTLPELPEYFQTWFEAGLQLQPKESDTESTSLAGKLFERASLFQMLCLVTERTPDTNPFLVGESYKYILAQLVPSQLWPDKPSSLLSNILLAMHYGLVADDNVGNVSIAFGMVAESYANFGLVGCVMLGVVLGYGYKRISVAAVGRPQFSALGLLTILLAAWSFQVEQIFATWLVSLLQAAAMVIGLPMAIRALFNPE